MSIDISFIIPIFNEKGVIDQHLPKLIEDLKAWDKEVELLLIDDGSTDGWSYEAPEPWIRLIRHPVNMGNGAAVKTGIRHAKGEMCLIMDGDGQHQFKDALAMVEKKGENALVVGARNFQTSGTLHRNTANLLYSRLASYVANYTIPDLTSGLRLFDRKKVLEVIHLFPNGFSSPTTMTLSLLRLGYTVAFHPIEVLPREGKSKIHLLKDGFRFLMIILKISTLFSPMKIFLPVAGSMFSVGVLTYLYFLFTEGRFSLWSVVLLTNAITIFMIGLVAEEISQMKLKRSEG